MVLRVVLLPIHQCDGCFLFATMVPPTERWSFVVRDGAPRSMPLLSAA